MASWRDHILKEFTPRVSRLTLVADPDGLLLEEGILEGIRERGFELIPFEDHVAFRYAYESRFRSRWDAGEETALVVVLRCGVSGLEALDVLPYDLLQAGRKLSFNLGDIFPHLSYPVVAALDRADLDALYDAQARYAPGPLGDNATKEFALRHVFEIAPELIKEPKDLLRVLLRRHYRGQRIPAILDERLIQLLRQNETFKDWPLEAIVPDREAFFAFLQERWAIFLRNILAVEQQSLILEGGDGDGDGGCLKRGASSSSPSISVDLPNGAYELKFAGPAEIPFDDGDIRIYLDNLFLERLLQPVPCEGSKVLSESWVRVGVRIDPIKDRLRRLGRLIENLRASMPAQDARYTEWLHFAKGWAESIVLIHERIYSGGAGGVKETPDVEDFADARDPRISDMARKIRELQSQIDAEFTAWLLKRYAGLSSLPSVPPVMLHHIPRYLTRYLGDSRQNKVALVILDGLSLDQWIVIRDTLMPRQPRFRFRENALFAWIPTVTSVSRQAIFAGRPPVLFPDSVHTTDKEPVLWTQFWTDQGFGQNEVAYAKVLGDGDLESTEELISDPRTRVVGLVVDKVDRITHGMQLGTAGMHNQVRQWAREPYLADLMGLLLNRGFIIFLTSDHGNIEAEGLGSPAEGAVADQRGERVRIYSDVLLREKIRSRFPDALPWPSFGLPEDYLPLIAPARRAFVRQGEHTVSHGGISIEEVIVPFIQIERVPDVHICGPSSDRSQTEGIDEILGGKGL